MLIRDWSRALFLGWLPLLAACVYSTHPLYDASVAISEPRIIGNWVCEDSDTSQTVPIRQSGPGVYELPVSDPESGRTHKMEIHLVRIGPDLFADASEREATAEGEAPRGPSQIAREHYLLKVWIDDESLRVAGLDYNWMKQQIDTKAIITPYKLTDDFSLVLTGTTAQLQAVIAQAARSPQAFHEPGVCRRQEHN